MSEDDDSNDEALMNALVYPGPIEEGLVYGQMVAESHKSTSSSRRVPPPRVPPPRVPTRRASNPNGTSVLLAVIVMIIILFGFYLLLGI